MRFQVSIWINNSYETFDISCLQSLGSGTNPEMPLSISWYSMRRSQKRRKYRRLQSERKTFDVFFRNGTISLHCFRYAITGDLEKSGLLEMRTINTLKLLEREFFGEASRMSFRQFLSTKVFDYVDWCYRDGYLEIRLKRDGKIKNR